MIGFNWLCGLISEKAILNIDVYLPDIGRYMLLSFINFIKNIVGCPIPLIFNVTYNAVSVIQAPADISHFTRNCLLVFEE